MEVRGENVLAKQLGLGSRAVQQRRERPDPYPREAGTPCWLGSLWSPLTHSRRHHRSLACEPAYLLLIALARSKEGTERNTSKSELGKSSKSVFTGPFFPLLLEVHPVSCIWMWVFRRVMPSCGPCPLLRRLADPLGPSLSPALRTCGHHSFVPLLALWPIGSHPPFSSGPAVE